MNKPLAMTFVEVFLTTIAVKAADQNKKTLFITSPDEKCQIETDASRQSFLPALN